MSQVRLVRLSRSKDVDGSRNDLGQWQHLRFVKLEKMQSGNWQSGKRLGTIWLNLVIVSASEPYNGKWTRKRSRLFQISRSSPYFSTASQRRGRPDRSAPAPRPASARAPPSGRRRATFRVRISQPFLRLQVGLSTDPWPGERHILCQCFVSWEDALSHGRFLKKLYRIFFTLRREFLTTMPTLFWNILF